MISAALPVTALAGPAKPQRNVAIVVYDNAEILDFAGPAEVLSAAGNFAGSGGKSALNIYLVARTRAPLHAQGFITVTPQYSINNAPKPDFVVIPGGNSDNLSNDPAMMKWLSSVTAASEVTLTVCTGAFPLAKSGAFDGMEITTWYGAVDNLQSIAPKAHAKHGRRFIDNGRYITTAGVSAGIDGALHLTARMFGRRVADQTARYMEYHWTPEPYLAAKYSYWNPSTDDAGRALQAAQLAIDEKRFDEAIKSLEQLAAHDSSGGAWLALANAQVAAGNRKAALTAYAKVPSSSHSYKEAIYNLGCVHALEGNKTEALAAVKKALAAGIKREHALRDPDLATIRDQIAKLR
ncbi:MAG: DJ-1/PfpI family protein [Kofleriaceae bacterium]